MDSLHTEIDAYHHLASPDDDGDTLSPVSSSDEEAAALCEEITAVITAATAPNPPREQRSCRDELIAKGWRLIAAGRGGARLVRVVLRLSKVCTFDTGTLIRRHGILYSLPHLADEDTAVDAQSDEGTPAAAMAPATAVCLLQLFLGLLRLDPDGVEALKDDTSVGLVVGTLDWCARNLSPSLSPPTAAAAAASSHLCLLLCLRTLHLLSRSSEQLSDAIAHQIGTRQSRVRFLTWSLTVAVSASDDGHTELMLEELTCELLGLLTRFTALPGFRSLLLQRESITAILDALGRRRRRSRESDKGETGRLLANLLLTLSGSFDFAAALPVHTPAVLVGMCHDELDQGEGEGEGEGRRSQPLLYCALNLLRTPPRHMPPALSRELLGGESGLGDLLAQAILLSANGQLVQLVQELQTTTAVIDGALSLLLTATASATADRTDQQEPSLAVVSWGVGERGGRRESGAVLEAASALVPLGQAAVVGRLSELCLLPTTKMGQEGAQLKATLKYKVACLLSQLTHFLPNRFIASWLTSGGPFSRLLVELLSSCNQEVQCWAMDILAAAIRRLEPSALMKWLFGCAAGGGAGDGGVWGDVSRCLEDITKQSVGLLQARSHIVTYALWSTCRPVLSPSQPQPQPHPSTSTAPFHGDSALPLLRDLGAQPPTATPTPAEASFLASLDGLLAKVPFDNRVIQLQFGLSLRRPSSSETDNLERRDSLRDALAGAQITPVLRQLYGSLLVRSLHAAIAEGGGELLSGATQVWASIVLAMTVAHVQRELCEWLIGALRGRVVLVAADGGGADTADKAMKHLCDLMLSLWWHARQTHNQQWLTKAAHRARSAIAQLAASPHTTAALWSLVKTNKLRRIVATFYTPILPATTHREGEGEGGSVSVSADDPALLAALVSMLVLEVFSSTATSDGGDGEGEPVKASDVVGRARAAVMGKDTSETAPPPAAAAAAQGITELPPAGRTYREDGRRYLSLAEWEASEALHTLPAVSTTSRQDLSSQMEDLQEAIMGTGTPLLTKSSSPSATAAAAAVDRATVLDGRRQVAEIVLSPNVLAGNLLTSQQQQHIGVLPPLLVSFETRDDCELTAMVLERVVGCMPLHIALREPTNAMAMVQLAARLMARLLQLQQCDSRAAVLLKSCVHLACLSLLQTLLDGKIGAMWPKEVYAEALTVFIAAQDLCRDREELSLTAVLLTLQPPCEWVSIHPSLPAHRVWSLLMTDSHHGSHQQMSGGDGVLGLWKESTLSSPPPQPHPQTAVLDSLEELSARVRGQGCSQGYAYRGLVKENEGGHPVLMLVALGAAVDLGVAGVVDSAELRSALLSRIVQVLAEYLSQCDAATLTALFAPCQPPTLLRLLEWLTDLFFRSLTDGAGGGGGDKYGNTVAPSCLMGLISLAWSPAMDQMHPLRPAVDGEAGIVTLSAPFLAETLALAAHFPPQMGLSLSLAEDWVVKARNLFSGWGASPWPCVSNAMRLLHVHVDVEVGATPAAGDGEKEAAQHTPQQQQQKKNGNAEEAAKPAGGDGGGDAVGNGVPVEGHSMARLQSEIDEIEDEHARIEEELQRLMAAPPPPPPAAQPAVLTATRAESMHIAPSPLPAPQPPAPEAEVMPNGVGVVEQLQSTSGVPLPEAQEAVNCVAAIFRQPHICQQLLQRLHECLTTAPTPLPPTAFIAATLPLLQDPSAGFALYLAAEEHLTAALDFVYGVGAASAAGRDIEGAREREGEG